MAGLELAVVHAGLTAGLVHRCLEAPTESSKINSEQHEPRTIQAEQAAGALVEIGGCSG